METNQAQIICFIIMIFLKGYSITIYGMELNNFPCFFCGIYWEHKHSSRT